MSCWLFTKERTFVSQGKYGQIYRFKNENGDFAIKSQKIKEKDRAELNSSLNKMLEEFIYYRIASVLGVGPRITNIFGYDIVCYNNALEFGMEYCEKYEDQENLKKDLL